ncbi:hypothetical protein N9934_03360 [Desulfosarcina sp.]|nr:hypothetical protein [Desulfosarcina sp.]
MNIDELTYGQIKEIASVINKQEDIETFLKIGNKYFVRTVTFHQVGLLKATNSKELLLSDASWIADSGRFNECLKTGKFDEVEPFVNDVVVNRDAIVDITEWDHDLPNVVK